jgi:Zn-dependent M28 family amino/carboxypeptidase
LPTATPEERDTAGRLRATVAHLAGEIGERNIERSWNLATATDDLAMALEKLGYEVRRQGVVVGDAVVQNLEAHVPGGDHGGQSVVVGAHFDTAPGSPGADDDASGVAAVLELARVFEGKRLGRTLRFALFVNGEAPYFQTPQMGSLAYAKQLLADRVEVVGMLSLDGIGVYSAEPGSERCPPELASQYPTTADFVAVVGNEASRALLDQVTASLRGHAAVPVTGSVLAAEVPFASQSDHWAFWTLGMPAVMITDTAPFRYAHHHQKADLPAELDFDRMARVVTALEKTLGEIAERVVPGLP